MSRNAEGKHNGIYIRGTAPASLCLHVPSLIAITRFRRSPFLLSFLFLSFSCGSEARSRDDVGFSAVALRSLCVHMGIDVSGYMLKNSLSPCGDFHFRDSVATAPDCV